jgi:TolB-like protein/Tfp pilus assembly protein PilF
MLTAMIYRFDKFEMDLDKAELRADGQRHPLEPRIFALLALLVQNADRLVSRDELLEKLWEGRVVSDDALYSAVKSARHALGDDGRAQRLIRTIHGRGFRFVADVQVTRPASAADATADPGKEVTAAATMPPPRPAAESRLSIAILPFQFMGRARRYAMFAEAIPHELITELARLRWILVTARGSSFRLRGAGLSMTDVGQLLGVRYCLTGTVETIGRKLVVTVELVHIADDNVIWAERFAGSIDDVHSVRDAIRAGVLTAVELQIPLHEAARARLLVTDKLDAWSAYHLGLQHMYRFNRVDNAAAAALFERAVKIDPDFARAHAGLSFSHFQTAFMHQSDDVAGDTLMARRCAERGLELDPLDPFVNFTMGRSFWLAGDLESGLAWLERATTLSPNYAQGLYARALMETLSGQGLEGRRHVDLAQRLSPLDPLFYAMLGTRAFSHMAEGEDVEAAGWAERAARSPGAHVLMAVIAAVAHSLAGNDELAQEWAANAHERNPGLSSEIFFRAFPIRSAAMRLRISRSLAGLGFQ